MSWVTSSATAHPHGWVDYRVTVMVDDQQRVTALEQSWKMDPFQSLTMVEGLENVEGNTSMAQRLDALGHEIAANLATQHYLTHVHDGDRELALGGIEDYTTRLDDNRVEFSFVLTLAEPQPLSDSLSWQIYDGTYFIEFLYDDRVEHPIQLLNAPSQCHAEIVHADPDPAVVARVSAIDVTDDAPDGIGKLFSDTGVIKCQSP
ncbi:ABC-type uncharacterized transport system, substrate-binding protein [Kushneria avicenniae]|uniref:ABC-type uncharacterized transport system, substrate-binding protein n=1 Tax=Kushneria avicenniae TaxID=402385 RepID=A0A1I1I4X8_9GAMM|nr:DUF1007 family protein [Kushneria avicenniae]SFC31377.1 ABC-type uncharacterized transport system, substrate-binding protein [Kushneria avicenniae]